MGRGVRFISTREYVSKILRKISVENKKGCGKLQVRTAVRFEDVQLEDHDLET